MTTKANGDPAAAAAVKEVHRPLTGAAKAAHDAKARGETVKVGRPFGKGGRAPAAAAARSSSSSSSGKAVGFLERVRRVL